MKQLSAMVLAILLLGTVVMVAQFRRGGRGQRPEPVDERAGVPRWEIDPQFSQDLFTFVRVRYPSWQSFNRVADAWLVDYPDSDYNLSFRLQQMTSLKVNPDPKILELTDKELFRFPFIYLIEPGAMDLTNEEIVALRRYLLNGGFLMVDDFWGVREWENFYAQIKRVFPDRELQELAIDHRIFNCVFPLKEKPQVPGIHNFRRFRGTSRESYERDDDPVVHYKALFDDKGRMMAIICHNTDLGDGWEREGEDEEYFHKYAEPKSYPMGINILFYAMTH